MAFAYSGGLLLALFALIRVCLAEEYTVGDRAGWQPGNVDYAQWASRHSYSIGDSLFFAYEKGSQSVMRVNQEDYHACRTSRPIEHHTSGNTLVHLRREDYYFISGVPGHCNAGMKLAIVLAGGSPSAAPTTTKVPPVVTPVAAPPVSPPAAPPTVPPVAPPTAPPVAPPTPSPLAPPLVAPASAPLISPPAPPLATPVAPPTAPASVPTPTVLPPPAPLPLTPSESPASPPAPSAASSLQSSFRTLLVAASIGIFYLAV